MPTDAPRFVQQIEALCADLRRIDRVFSATGVWPEDDAASWRHRHDAVNDEIDAAIAALERLGDVMDEIGFPGDAGLIPMDHGDPDAD